MKFGDFFDGGNEFMVDFRVRRKAGAEHFREQRAGESDETYAYKIALQVDDDVRVLQVTWDLAVLWGRSYPGYRGISFIKNLSEQELKGVGEEDALVVWEAAVAHGTLGGKPVEMVDSYDKDTFTHRINLLVMEGYRLYGNMAVDPSGDRMVQLMCTWGVYDLYR